MWTQIKICEPWEEIFCLQKTSTSMHAVKKKRKKKLSSQSKTLKHWVKVVLRAFVKSQCCKKSQIIYTFPLALKIASLEISELHFKLIFFCLSIINLVEHDNVLAVRKFTSSKEQTLIYKK